MKTFFDYLRENGNVPLSEDNFCDADAMIFSCLSYLNLPAFCNEEREEVPFKEVFNLSNFKTLKKGSVLPPDEKKLLKHFEKSNRYDDLILSRVHKVDDKDNMISYQSYVLSLKDEMNLIIFRGTNLDFNGCIENLQFALEDGARAKTIAKEDLEYMLHASKLPLYCIGHSKGGAVLEAGLVSLSRDDQMKIAKAYLIDSPGCKTIYEEEKIEILRPKVKKYITKRSIFGLLLNNNFDYEVINAKVFWLLHHMPYNYEIDNGSLKPVKKCYWRTYNRHSIVEKFLKGKSDEDIQILISDFESILKYSNIFSIFDLRITRIFKAIAQITRVFLFSRRRRNNLGLLIMCFRTFL